MNTTTYTPKKIQFVRNKPAGYPLSRRALLGKGLALGSSFIVGSGFVASSSAVWAMGVNTLSPAAMATLVQMARDIYPHDQFGDELYALAVKGHDDKAADDAEFKSMIEAGIEEGLNQPAVAAGSENYVSLGWEADRVKILRSIESTPFFEAIRGGLVVSLYNQQAVWELLGYEGSSFEKGGYLDRGFDDVAWL